MSEQIKITVGAVKSASVGRTFNSIKNDAKKLAQYLDKLKLGGGKVGRLEYDAERAGKHIWRAVNMSAKRLELAGRKIAASIDSAARQASGGRAGGARASGTRDYRPRRDYGPRSFGPLEPPSFRAARRERERAANGATRDEERMRDRLLRAQARSVREGTRRKETLATRIGGRAARTTMHMGGEGMRRTAAAIGPGEIMAGLGMRMDASTSMQSAMDTRFKAQQIANLGRTKESGRRYSQDEVLTAANEATSTAKFFTTMEALDALDAYVTKTGDIASGIAQLPSMAEIAGATGSNLSDMSELFAGVKNMFRSYNLSPADEQRKTEEVVRALSGQGKLGAVEVKDMAKQAELLTSTVPFYSGDPVKTAKDLGALTQISKMSGGSSTPTQAMRSASRFLTTFQTGARLKAADRLGVEAYGEDGKVRSAPELIRDIIDKTGTDSKKYNSVMANVVGARFVHGIRAGYMTARDKAAPGATEQEKHELGMKSVGLGAFQDATLTKAQSQQDIAALNTTSKAASVEFQRKMDQVADSFMIKLAPAVDRLTPKLIEMAEAVSGFLSWALPKIVDNPKMAAGAVGLGILGASTMGAVVEGGVQASIASMMMRRMQKPGLVMGPLGNMAAGAPLLEGLGGIAPATRGVAANIRAAGGQFVSALGPATLALTAAAGTIAALSFDLGKNGYSLGDITSTEGLATDLDYLGIPPWLAGAVGGAPLGIPGMIAGGFAANKYVKTPKQEQEERDAEAAARADVLKRPGVRSMTAEEFKETEAKRAIDEKVAAEIKQREATAKMEADNAVIQGRANAALEAAAKAIEKASSARVQ